MVFCAFPQEFELTLPTKANVAYIGGIHVKPLPTNASYEEGVPSEIIKLIDSHSAGFGIVALGHLANWVT